MSINQPPRIAILGSTGSIGRSALDVIAHHPDAFDLALISCHERLDLFREQCAAHRPKHAVVTGPCTPEVAQWLRDPTSDNRRAHGMANLVDAVAKGDIDVVVAAIVGIAGLETSLAAAQTGKRLALANKESLVVAGELLMDAAQRSGAELIPVDSEHSAIFQSIRASQDAREVRRLILTASGGPLREWPIESLADATVDDALAHPTWNMGKKITVDSATMMNKALEVIEARWLFQVSPEQIEVVIHPQSIIHSMVEFCDGSVIAQMSPPDMRLPIQYALTYPKRLDSPARKIDWGQPYQLDWKPVDLERYPALELGFEVARRGGTCGAVLNAANEAAVDLFLHGKIRLTEIAAACRSVLANHHYSPSPTLAELMRLDQWSRDEVSRWIKVSC
ncbi:MAG: 1-deoxy-D-xylulose-5-phosphate reductoisomerase [Planctomycetota bacterium]|jgi:1-deoxy-D-xylulose-5-phosphate reductoisomerase